jgi:hypothetical protein
MSDRSEINQNHEQRAAPATLRRFLAPLRSALAMSKVQSQLIIFEFNSRDETSGRGDLRNSRNQ